MVGITGRYCLARSRRNSAAFRWREVPTNTIIVDSPYYAAVDEKGGFQIANVPDGTATLKVWTRGKWVAEQEIDGGSTDELTIKVISTHETESKPAPD